MSDLQPKIALVIGVNGGPETGLAPLRYAEETARQVADMLASSVCNFTLHGGGPLLGEAATTDAVRRAIFDARRAAGQHGTLLIYFIGHGRYVTDHHGHSDVYLVTSNFRTDDARDDPHAHLSMEWLQEKVLRHHTPDRLLIVLDCCYAGAVGDAAPDPVVANLRRRLAQALDIQAPDTNRGVVSSMRKTLAAVSPWQKAYERDGATCYSAALLHGLRGAAVLEDGRVTWQSLHALLQRELADYQPGEYGFDRSEGVVLAYYPDRARVRTPNHQPFVIPHVPLPDADFVGREEELQRLAAMLIGADAGDVALLPAITGIGGIGKTRLAIEFVHRYRHHFPDGIFWLTMERPDTIEAQIAACGGTRGLQLFDDDQSELSSRQSTDFDGGTRNTERLSLHQRAELVRTIWEQPGCRLIIFDNLEDPALLHQWRPRGGGSRLLITTRRQTWATTSGVRTFSLNTLSDAASQALLLRPRAADRGCTIDQLLADPAEAKAAQAIIQELGGLPLALTLAGGYLAKSSVTLTRYRELLRSESIRHQSLNQELSEGLPQAERASIVAAFALSYQRLGDDPIDSLARTIWLAAAQLAPEPILEEVLMRAAAIDPADEDRCEQGTQALQRLRELGLIERSADGYRLHRLLGAYARSVSPDCAADWRRAAQGLAQTIQRLDDEWELSAPPFRDHIRRLLDAQMAGRDADSAALFHAAGLVMYADDNYPTARCYYEEALAIKDDVLGRRHRETAVTLHELGKVAQAAGDYPTARRYYEEALAIKDDVLGRRHRETAVTLHELGKVAQAAGDYPTARRYYEEALAIKDDVLGRRHRETAVTLHALGNLAQEEGDYPTARRYYEEALAIKDDVLGRRHRETAVTLHALGKVAQAAGDYPTARRYFLEDLEITEAVLGRRHRETAVTLHALGKVAQAAGDYPTARRYYEEALAIKDDVLGRRHRETAVTLHELGKVAQAAGDYPTARRYYEEALAIKDDVLGRRHRETAVTLHELGKVAQAAGDYPTARRYYEEALAIFEAVLGRRHRETAVTLHELGKVAQAAGDYPTARRYYEEALAIFEAVLGRRHRETAVTLHALGNLAQEEGDYPTARRYYEEALAIKDDVLGRRHRETAVTLHALGKVAQAAGDYPTARRYYEEALAIKDDVLGRRHRETAVTLHALGNLAQEEGDYPTARRYFLEDLEITEAVLGRRHRETAVTLHALGNLAQEEGDYPTARRYYEEALAIKDDVLGRRHRSTAVTLHALGNLAQEEGDYPTARRYFLEDLEITEAVLGRRHRSTAVTLHALGNLAQEEGDYPTARRYFLEDLEITEAVLGRRHRETAVTLHALGNLAQEEGDYPTARRYYEEALAIKDDVLGRRHRSTAVTLHALGNLAQEEGDYPTARRYYEEALAIFEAVLGRRHRETFITRFARGWLVWQAIWETAACAVLTWFVLPDQIALIGAGLVLVLGAVGYFRWRQATGVVRVLWRVQVGWLVTLLLLNLLDPAPVDLSPVMVYALAAGGAALGLLWPRIMALPALRTARLRGRRWLYRGLQRLRALRRR